MDRLEELWETAGGQQSRLPDGFAASLADGWTQLLGSRSPRIAIREYISVLDRARDYPDFDPVREYRYALESLTLSPEETEAHTGVPVAVADDELF